MGPFRAGITVELYVNNRFEKVLTHEPVVPFPVEGHLDEIMPGNGSQPVSIPIPSECPPPPPSDPEDMAEEPYDSQDD